MLKTLLIGFILMVFVVVVVFLVRKVIFGVIVCSLLLLCGLFALNYYNISINEISTMVAFHENVKDLKGAIEYDSDNKTYNVKGENYNLEFFKDNNGEYVIAGETKNISEEGVKGLFGMLELANSFVNVEGIINDLLNLSDAKSVDDVNEVANNVVNETFNGIADVIENPESFIEEINNMQNTNKNSIKLGNFNVYVEGDMIKVNNKK